MVQDTVRTECNYRYLVGLAARPPNRVLGAFKMKFVSELRGVLAAAIVLATGAAAQAAPILYNVDATCRSVGSFVCADVGLTDGDAVGGSITFDDTNFASGASLDTSDVLSFDVAFGAHTLTDMTAAGFSFFGILDTDGSTFFIFNFIAAEVLFPDRGKFFSISDGDSGTISTNGTCIASDCDNAGSDVPFARLDNTALTKAAVVTEPAALGFVAIGLAVFGAARRRRSF